MCEDIWGPHGGVIQTFDMCLALACDVIQSLIVNINTDQVALCTDLIGVAVNVTEGCGKLSKIDVTAVLIFKYSPK